MEISQESEQEGGGGRRKEDAITWPLYLLFHTIITTPELSSFVFVYLRQYSFVILLWNHTDLLSPPSAAIQRPGRSLLHFHVARRVVAGSYATLRSLRKQDVKPQSPSQRGTRSQRVRRARIRLRKSSANEGFFGESWRTSHKVRFLSDALSIY